LDDHVAYMEETIDIYIILVIKLEGGDQL